MINIYNRSEEEINKPMEAHRLGDCVFYTKPEKVCPTYIVSNGSTIDTDKLGEDKIMELIDQDLYDYSSENGTYKFFPRELDSFEFINSVIDNWDPSHEAILSLFLMQEKYGNIVSDVLGYVDKNGIISKACIIAGHQKRLNSDFSCLTSDDIRKVLEQMLSIKKKMIEIRNKEMTENYKKKMKKKNR